MEFTINHSRDIIGNKISVMIKSDRTSLISSVKITLDAFELSDTTLDSPSTHFSKSFVQAGGAGPGYDHTLIVQATDKNNYTESATEEWQDDH